MKGGGGFWQSHLNASERHGNECVSLGSTTARLYENNFTTWLKLFDNISFSGNATITNVAKLNSLKVSLTPYGKYRLEDKVRQPAANNNKKNQEEIFWELLVNPTPDLIAQASAKAPFKPLQMLAQKTLQEIAKVSWEKARAIARRSLNLKDPEWQSLEDWEKTYSSQKKSLYPENEISLWKAIKTGKSPISTLGIFYQIFKFGLTSSARHNGR